MEQSDKSPKPALWTSEPDLPPEMVWTDPDQFLKPIMYWMLRKFGGRLTREDIEDAAHDAVVDFLKDRDRASEIRNPVARLRTMASNKCVDAFRKKIRRKTEPLEGDASVHWTAALDELPDDWGVKVADALRSLTLLQYEIVCLRILEEMKFEEISQRLGVSVSTAFENCAKALAVLRRKMQPRD